MNKLEKPIGVKKQCELAGVKYSSVRGYLERHKGEELNINEIIQMYKDKSKIKKQPFSELCRKYNIDYNRAKTYKRNHTDLTDIQIIENLKQIDNKETFKDKCNRYNIDYSTASGYKRRLSHLTDDEIIQCIIQSRKEKESSLTKRLSSLGITPGQFYGVRQKHKHKTNEEIIQIILARSEKVDNSRLKQLCIKYGINYGSASQYKRKYNCSDTEVINHFLPNIGKLTFTDKCKEANINVRNAISYRHAHPELTDEEVIEHYKKELNRVETLGEKCRKAGVKYASAYGYKKRHPELTDEEAIEHLKSVNITRHDDLINYCKILSIDYKKAYEYKRIHKLSTEETIIHFKPHCYISILGEFIIPE